MVEGEPLRVHLHAVLRFKHQCVKRKDTDLAFEDATAMPSVGSKQKRTQKDAGFNELTGNAAFFYLQVAKTSSIVTSANYLPFKNYVVNSDWVINMWQQGKVMAPAARAVVVQCKKNVPTLLANWGGCRKRRQPQTWRTLSATSQRASAQQWCRAVRCQRWRRGKPLSTR